MNNYFSIDFLYQDNLLPFFAADNLVRGLLSAKIGHGSANPFVQTGSPPSPHAAEACTGGGAGGADASSSAASSSTALQLLLINIDDEGAPVCHLDHYRLAVSK